MQNAWVWFVLITSSALGYLHKESFPIDPHGLQIRSCILDAGINDLDKKSIKDLAGQDVCLCTLLFLVIFCVNSLFNLITVAVTLFSIPYSAL